MFNLTGPGVIASFSEHNNARLTAEEAQRINAHVQAQIATLDALRRNRLEEPTSGRPASGTNLASALPRSASIPVEAANGESLASTAELVMPPLEEERDPRLNTRDNNIHNVVEYVLDNQQQRIPVFEEMEYEANDRIIGDFRNVYEMQGVWSIGHVELIQAQQAQPAQQAQQLGQANQGYWDLIAPRVNPAIQSYGGYQPRAYQELFPARSGLTD